MKIGFDWQGTLDIHKTLYQMAIDLRFAGWEVLIISAMPVTMPGIREKEIEVFMANLEPNAQLPYKVVYHELENYHQAAGEAKIKLMKELGINLYVDDTEEVARTVRNAGIEVLHI